MTKYSNRSTDSTRYTRGTTFRESCTNGQTITYVMKSIAYYNHPRHGGNLFQSKLLFSFIIAEYWAAWQACFKAFRWFYCCIMMMIVMIEGYSISVIFKVAFSILQLEVRLIYFISFKTINKEGRKTTTTVQKNYYPKTPRKMYEPIYFIGHQQISVFLNRYGTCCHSIIISQCCLQIIIKLLTYCSMFLMRWSIA